VHAEALEKASDYNATVIPENLPGPTKPGMPADKPHDAIGLRILAIHDKLSRDPQRNPGNAPLQGGFRDTVGGEGSKRAGYAEQGVAGRRGEAT